MIPKEIFQKVRQIEIATKRLVSDVFAGQYHSVFKGQGIEFDEVREYQYGDDVRSIDWNVTARTGKPHIKKFVEERELTVMILVDVSSSNRFASVNMLKSQLAAEVSALLALSATRNNDKVGLIIFTDRIEKFIPPRKGRAHVLRVIREVLYFKPQGHSTDLVQVLDYLNKVTTRKTIAFLISDFIIGNGLPQDPLYQNLRKALKIANKRHDLIGVTLNDPREFELKGGALMVFEDAESAQTVLIDTSDRMFLRSFQKKNEARRKNLQQLFRLTGMDFVDVSTASPYADELIKFFLKRRKRRS